MTQRDELYADLYQWYGVDLERELGAGNFAKLRTLTTQLPAGARIFAEAAPAASWTVDTYMLAAIVDNLSFLRYEQAGGKGKKPKQIPRPTKRAKAKHKRLDVSAQRRQELLFGARRQDN